MTSIVTNWDVKTAFLNGDVDQDVFMAQPEGCIFPERPNFVAIYRKHSTVLNKLPDSGTQR